MKYFSTENLGKTKLSLLYFLPSPSQYFMGVVIWVSNLVLWSASLVMCYFETVKAAKNMSYHSRGNLSTVPCTQQTMEVRNK